MYRIIRDHNKKLMAVFAVVLMVAFLLPAGFQNSGDRSGAVRARMGDAAITVGDFQRARADWEILTKDAYTTTGFGQEIPLLLRLGNPSPQRLAVLIGQAQPYQFPNAPIAPVEVVRNPQTFLLLWKEAQAAGVVIPAERLDQVMKTEVITRPGMDPQAEGRVRQAVRDFLMVEASYARVANVAKATAPIRQRTLAERFVRITADVVSFDAAPAGIPTTAAVLTTAPTDEMLQAQFGKYADVAPGAPTESNPFGFGYRLPDRVKVQTIALPRAALKAVVQGTRKPRQWDVEARTYFYSHTTEFPSTQPTSLPAASSGFDLSAAPATQPKERTYDDLSAVQKQQALDNVMRPEIDALQAKVVAYLTDRLSKDYAAAAPSTQPTAQATTQPAGGYTSYSYLEQLALDVQKQFGVLPAVSDRADWLDRTTAATLDGIGSASSATGSTFVTTVFGAQPFVTGDANATPPPLQMHEFSGALNDFEDNAYLFRLTSAEPSHRPASLNDVRPQVTLDVQRQSAADAAQAAGKSLVEAATKAGFRPAAGSTGRTVQTVGPLDMQNGYAPITGIEIPEDDRQSFFRGVATLLSSATRDPQGRPLGTVVLPNARKVLAVNITEAPVQSTPNGPFSDQLAAAALAEGQMSAIVQMDWFSFDGVAKRIDYKGDRPDGPDAGPTAMAQ